EQKLVPPCGRRIAGAKARGNEAVKRWIRHGGVRNDKADSVCGAAAEHRPTIKGINAHAFEVVAGKDIDRQVIGAATLRIARRCFFRGSKMESLLLNGIRGQQ